MSNQISQADLAKATKAAEKSGVPQAVKDGAGHLAYYVDGTGAVVPRGIAEDAIQRSQAKARTDFTASGHFDGHGGFVHDQTAAEKKANEAGAAADQAAGANALKLNALNAAHGSVWVNGQKATVVGMAADGTPIYSYEGGAKDPKTGAGTLNKTAGTAFSALNGLGANTNAAAMWTSSVSPTDIFSGQAPDASAPKLGDHGTEANTVSGVQQMTVGQGVQWFLNLSVQHPDVYQHLLDQLKAANYVNPKSPGGYGNDAAVGAAQAMADLAQVNSTEGGRTVTLDQFLAGKAHDAAKQAAATVQPTNRSYQDPATLAMTAKSAAQQALGRALTPDEEKHFEAAFRGKEDAAFGAVDASNRAQAAAAATNSTAPGASVTMPDTTGEADQFVNANPQFAQEKAGYSALEYTKALQSFLSGGNL